MMNGLRVIFSLLLTCKQLSCQTQAGPGGQGSHWQSYFLLQRLLGYGPVGSWSSAELCPSSGNKWQKKQTNKHKVKDDLNFKLSQRVWVVISQSLSWETIFCFHLGNGRTQQLHYWSPFHQNSPMNWCKGQWKTKEAFNVLRENNEFGPKSKKSHLRKIKRKITLLYNSTLIYHGT